MMDDSLKFGLSYSTRKLSTVKTSSYPWVPADLAGCVLWLRSDLGVTKDGSNRVSSWADKSGQENNFVQTVGANQPLYVASDSNFNNNPSINFDTIDANMMASKTEVYPTQTLIFVCKMGTQNRYVFCGKVFSNSAVEILDQEPLSMLLVDAVTVNFANVEFSSDYADPVILTLCQNSSDSTINAYDNGNPSPGNPINWIGADFNTERYMLGYADNESDWRVTEIIEYSFILSDVNRLLVENYLNGRYAIY